MITMKEIVRGCEIFKTRRDYLASRDDISLPPIYKAFYSTFEVGRGKMQVPGVYLPQIDQVAGILNQKISTPWDFILYDFLTIEESKILVANTYDKNDPSIEKYWPIGECDSNKNLVVCKDHLNQDQIYLENLTLFADGDRYKLLSKNILEFMTMISYVENEVIGYGIKDYSVLYKKWTEGFWRYD